MSSVVLAPFSELLLLLIMLLLVMLLLLLLLLLLVMQCLKLFSVLLLVVEVLLLLLLLLLRLLLQLLQMMQLLLLLIVADDVIDIERMSADVECERSAITRTKTIERVPSPVRSIGASHHQSIKQKRKSTKKESVFTYLHWFCNINIATVDNCVIRY